MDGARKAAHGMELSRGTAGRGREAVEFPLAEFLRQPRNFRVKEIGEPARGDGNGVIRALRQIDVKSFPDR